MALNKWVPDAEEAALQSVGKRINELYELHRRFEVGWKQAGPSAKRPAGFPPDFRGNQDFAKWMFNAPAAEVLAAVTLWEKGYAAMSAETNQSAAAVRDAVKEGRTAVESVTSGDHLTPAYMAYMEQLNAMG